MNEYNNLPQGLLMALSALAVIAIVVGIMLYCAYIKNLQDLLKAVREHNRLMPPAQVWLLAVIFLNLLAATPAVIMAWSKVDARVMSSVFSGVSLIRNVVTLFVLYWQLRVVQKVADSIELEYRSRNIAVESRPTFQLGLAYVSSLATGFVLDFLSIRFLDLLATVASLIFWIMYWLKTVQFKKALKAMPPDPDEESPLFRNLY